MKCIPSPLTIRALTLFFANLASLCICITYNQVVIRPYVVSGPDKAGVTQPKLAYRLDCHNIMHKKLSGIILNLQENCCFWRHVAWNPYREKIPRAILNTTLRTHFSACFKSHASTFGQLYSRRDVPVYLFCGCGWLLISAEIPVKVKLKLQVKNFGPRALGFERVVIAQRE